MNGNQRQQSEKENKAEDEDEFEEFNDNGEMGNVLDNSKA